MTKCVKCNKIKNTGEFYRRSDTGNLRSECKACRNAYNIKKRKQNQLVRNPKLAEKKAEKARVRAKKWKKNNPEKVRINRVKENAKNRAETAKKKAIKMAEYRQLINRGILTCKACATSKPLSEFHFRKDSGKYRPECKICWSNRCLKYAEENKPRIRGIQKQWHMANKDNIQVRLAHTLRSRISALLRGKVKSGSAVKDLGCSISQLKRYIEVRFVSGMTWDNYGQYGWHIDHIMPLSSFDLENRKQFLKACHYTNLQPLWAEDNLRKSNKIL